MIAWGDGGNFRHRTGWVLLTLQGVPEARRVDVEVKRRGGEVEGEELDQLLGVFIFFLYHAFILFRYKELRGVLAMEKTKPINQTPNIKKQISSSSTNLESRQNNRLSLTNK